ncbi:phosphotransferase family protein [Gordonia polyisoprenivorans]|uniref:phosphotransferase family protein n=1 Tax=Gordonia polyisoprenivorans TaxID=84595 RepID=UPI001AD617C5|nr:aminoglycoside phosphotransferase family protein [Gordonia polyisoprenivorans]QTI69158.1 aminoglycoside phosphotransferase family protein [Gordonia polyisoprenivorans]
MTATPGRQLATGRTADIFEWGPDRVVKVFTGALDDAAIATEVRDSIEANTLGITPIRCHGIAALDDGRDAIVFDRLDGVALTTVAERRPYRIPAVARMLAAEQARIHAARSDVFPDVREVAVSLLDTAPLSDLDDTERDTLRRRIRALPSGDSVLHLDFHPLNVFEHDGGLATIDWQSAAVGDPAADVAATSLLFTEAELFPGISALQRVVYQSVRRVMLRFYLTEYRRRTGIGPERIAPWMTTARILRLGWLNVESERTDLLARIRADLCGTDPSATDQ